MEKNIYIYIISLIIYAITYLICCGCFTSVALLIAQQASFRILKLSFVLLNISKRRFRHPASITDCICATVPAVILANTKIVSNLMEAFGLPNNSYNIGMAPAFIIN